VQAGSDGGGCRSPHLLAYKPEKEIDAIRLRAHTHEFAMYYDI
jgi:hypothetical protein